MAVNKVVINTENGAETIVDLTGDSVNPAALAQGYTAHDSSGKAIEGTMPTTSVLYTQQTLTNEQRTQARYNIDALGASDVVNDLVSFSPERPLSAEQGAILKEEQTHILEEIDLVASHKADVAEGTFFVQGGGTTDGTANTSAWTGTSDRIRAYYDGLTIRYKIGVVGESTTTLNINGLGAKTVYRFNTTKLTTQFPVGSIIHLTYHTDLNGGCWMCNDYDANTNTYQRLYPSTGNTEYPITARYNTTSGSSYYAEYGRYVAGVTLNPSTKTITATKFKGELVGNASSATKATQDGNGNTITSTYETKADAVARSSQLSAKIDEITPVRGEDYWTAEDVENILGEANTLIADEMARKNQLKPEFVNSIEDCTDPNKLYVLPDNEIYAYIKKEAVKWTNAVSTATAVVNKYPTTEIYNGVGYLNCARLTDLGTNAQGEQNNAYYSKYMMTGCISYKLVNGVFPTIYVKGLPWTNGDSNVRINFYRQTSEGAIYDYINGGLNITAANGCLEQAFTMETLGENYWKLTPKMSDMENLLKATHSAYKLSEISVIRFSLEGKGENLVISLNNPIETTYDYDWYSAGHEFVSIPTEDPVVQEIIKNNVAELRVKPEFVDSVEECIDTNKVYVLPDGYIYTYTTGLVENWENAITASTDNDGNIYNGIGYKNNTYVSDGVWTNTSQNITATGLIPYARKADGTYPTIYIKGLSWSTNSYSRLYCVAPNYQTIVSTGTSAPTRFDHRGNNDYLNTNFIIEKKVGDEWIATTSADTGTYWRLIPNELFTSEAKIIDSGSNKFTWIKMSLEGDGANFIISVDEPIEPTIETSWRKTQCTFAPADYEDRIIENENKINDLNRRVSIVEAMGGGSGEGVESYVQEEAERVALEVYKRQNANTFTFLAISDMHYHTNNAQIIKSNIHAGQGMDLVRKGVNVDFAVCLGDNAWGSGIEGDANRATIELGIAEIRGANKCIDAAFRGIPNIRTVGNHDPLGYNYSFNNNDWLDGDEIFPLYGAYNRGAVYPADKKGGYCYRDFEDWKLRVICVNTTEDCTKYSATPKDTYVSPEQLQWFAQAIDLSAKTDASEWSILIFSHQPLEMAAQTRMVKILEAYINGTSITTDAWEGKTVTYSYSGKNAATIIGNIHGHNHNFQVDNLRKYVGSSKTEPISVKRICVPNACYSRSNERGQNGTLDLWDIEYGETTTYNKTPNSATDTAFNVFTIDPVARKIFATNYGAGIDREISY